MTLADLLADIGADPAVIDRGCLVATLEAWFAQPDGEPARVFYAPAVHRLACGHVRPTNTHVEPGTTYPCVICERRVEVVGTELLDGPTEFPHPSALDDLPCPA